MGIRHCREFQDTLWKFLENNYGIDGPLSSLYLHAFFGHLEAPAVISWFIKPMDNVVASSTAQGGGGSFKNKRVLEVV